VAKWGPFYIGKDPAMAEKKDKDKDKRSDLKKIKELIELMKEHELVELEIRHDDDKIFLKRSEPRPPTVTAVPILGPNVSASLGEANAAEASPDGGKSSGADVGMEEGLVEIKSPIVGTFYSTPSPDSEPYVEVGSVIGRQTVVCIVEAMKVMNEIKAEASGTIVEVVVKNGEAVEYGQVLFRVKPD
jgi:acetyl-CoA carboxylase biotin carboxyl carrier protein